MLTLTLKRYLQSVGAFQVLNSASKRYEWLLDQNGILFHFASLDDILSFIKGDSANA